MQLPAILLLLFVFTSGARAESRLALLIGNRAYSEKVGPIKTPHNDIALVGAALGKISLKVTRVGAAGCEAIHTALKRHIQEAGRAGKDTICFVYYPDHGAYDSDTQINCVIPDDVTSADSQLWTNPAALVLSASLFTVEYGATQKVRGSAGTSPVK